MGRLPQRVLVAGGGTGGHLFPGIAVADELRARGTAEIRFVGSTHGIERNSVPRAGYAVELLEISGLRGRGLGGATRAALAIPRATLRCRRLVKQFRPELAIGVGGYAAFPAIVAAFLARVPIVLMEQNAQPGWVTRVLSPLARRVCVSFPETLERFRRSGVLTGNPVRWAARSGLDERAAGPFRLFVFGGSAGARRLNQIVPAAVARAAASLEVLHQTGTAECDEVRTRYAAEGLEARVVPFVDDMAAAYAWADLVVCRAGASTLAELMVLGVAALLVPYPFAAGDHQARNAEALVRVGAAWIVLDRDLEPIDLAARLDAAASDPAGLRALREAARRLGRPDAAAHVVDECLAVVAR